MKALLALLPRAFPRAFRAEFASGMREVVFADYDQARARGRGAALWCVISTLGDTLVAAFSERLNPTWIEPNARLRARRWQMSDMLESWARDFKHAARGLARAPMFTVVVVVTLALAIGANTAIFSVAKVVLLEPLPFPNANRLVHIGGTAPGSELPGEFGVSDELYFEYHERAPALQDLGLYGTGSSTTRVDGQVEQLFFTRATASFFTTLGVRPFLGRLPTEEDDDGVVVISHWLWQDWFGSDPDVVGRSYYLARDTRTVIGVLRPEFRFPDERVAFWMPLPIRAAQATAGEVDGANVVARMAPGADGVGLVAQLAPLARRVQERLGGSASYARIIERHRPVVTPLREHMVGNVGTAL
ncbi:MAG: ABC transporter permease, partial [Longimicrobiales bacterium]